MAEINARALGAQPGQALQGGKSCHFVKGKTRQFHFVEVALDIATVCGKQHAALRQFYAGALMAGGVAIGWDDQHSTVAEEVELPIDGLDRVAG